MIRALLSEARAHRRELAFDGLAFALAMLALAGFYIITGAN